MLLPEICLGPPGCGKTTTLLRVVEEELERGIKPDKIAFLSFTRRASEEAIDRAQKKFGYSRSQFPYFRTIHSFAYHQLGLRNSEIFEGSKVQEFAKWVGIRITGNFSEDGLLLGMEGGDKILFLENLARIKRVPLRDLYNETDIDISWAEIDRVVRALKVFKQENGLLDFTDMLENYLHIGNSPTLQILICDETQDQSNLQWDIVTKLSKGTQRWVIAGDDDQNLYHWAGSSSDRLINQDGEVRVLDQSYRVPRKIQNLALSIINRVSFRRQKEWSPRDEEGEIDHVSDFHKVDLSGDDILILVRNTYLLNDLVIPELRRQGVIFDRNGHLSVKSNVLKAIVDWESLRAGNFVPVPQIINIYDHMTSGIGVKRGFKKLPAWQEDQQVDMILLKQEGGLLVDSIWSEALDRIPANDRSYIVAARKKGERVLQKPRVRVSTIHAAKGGEANHVVLLKEMARKSYREMDRDPDAENRVWYVGVTRSRNKLTIVDSRTDKSYPFI